MQKQGMRMAVCAMGAAILLAGCGKNKNENIASGMELVEQLLYEDALTSFDKALLNNEDKEQIYRGQALAHMGMTMYEEATDELLKAFEHCDGKVGALELDMNYYLAASYVKQDKCAEAEETYSAILAMRPKEVDAWFLRGCTRLQLENTEQAITDFSQAQALKPGDVDLAVDIYQALADAGEEQEGQSYLQNMITEKGDKISDYDLGKISYYLEDYETARTKLDSVLNDKNAGADVSLILGKTYEALGDLNYAVVVYTKYLDGKDPANVEILNALGVCRMKLQVYDEALNAFQTGIAIENNSMMQTLKFNEIVAYEYKGDFSKAKSLMESYLAAYPDDEKAVREARFLRTR